jgi:hypothetical protein
MKNTLFHEIITKNNESKPVNRCDENLFGNILLQVGDI